MTNTAYKVKFINDEFYIENNGLIIDECCPNCNRIIIDPVQKCFCGEMISNPLKKHLYHVCLAFGICSVCILFVALGIFEFGIVNKVNVYTVSPAEVIVRTTLKNSKYNDYIQNIYINPKQESELVVFIKPSYWSILNKIEKKEILDKALKDWQKIYKENNKDSKESVVLKIKPTVVFANK